MEAFLGLSAWMAGVFLIIKLVFKYLAWLYHDKDKTLRENVQQAWDYVSQHSYFEVAKHALAKLYDRLATIFQKRIRFFYLSLVFLFLNLASLLLARYWIGFDLAEVRDVLLTMRDLIAPWKKLSNLHVLRDSIGFVAILVSLFQLSLLDLYSFLFTIGIIRTALHSKTIIQFLIELISDLLMLGLFFVVVFQCFYYWLIKDILVSLFGSFLVTLLTSTLIWPLSMILKRFWRLTSQGISYRDPFSPLFRVLALGPVAFFFLLATAFACLSLIDSIRDFSVFLVLFIVPSSPLVVLWCIRVFKPLPRNKVVLALRFVATIVLVLMLGYGTLASIDSWSKLPETYSIISSAVTSNFVLILVFSSAFPTIAHLLAVLTALIGKATPTWAQQFINNHLYALSRNEEKVLGQLGNAFGAIGALITGIIKLI